MQIVADFAAPAAGQHSYYLAVAQAVGFQKIFARRSSLKACFQFLHRGVAHILHLHAVADQGLPLLPIQVLRGQGQVIAVDGGRGLQRGEEGIQLFLVHAGIGLRDDYDSAVVFRWVDQRGKTRLDGAFAWGYSAVMAGDGDGGELSVRVGRAFICHGIPPCGCGCRQWRLCVWNPAQLR